MKAIKQIHESIFYCYTPNEFLPIFVDGKLSNKAEFAAYKLKKILINKTLV